VALTAVDPARDPAADVDAGGRRVLPKLYDWRCRSLRALLGQVDQRLGGTEVLAAAKVTDRLDAEGLLEVRRGTLADPGERGHWGVDEFGQVLVLVLLVDQLDEVRDIVPYRTKW
jgi:hypothetical protein